MKKWMTMLLVLALVLTGGSGAAKECTDSLGRSAALPEEITRVAVTGPLAQIAVFAVAPDLLAGISGAWDESSLDIVGAYADLPVLGQLYGGKGEMNLEAVAAAAPEVIIDVGEPKDGISEDLDALSAQLGIPVLHVTMNTAAAPDAFRMLGQLLGREAAGEALSAYCEEIMARMDGVMASVGEGNKARLLYCLGENGLNVIAKGSYHAEIIDMLSDNLAVVEAPSSRGTGNEADMEQILMWNPDVILFAPDSIGETVGTEPVWQSVKAISEGHYAVVPFGPYNWMGFPPSVQRYLGMLWMAQLLYPDACDYDLYEEVARYYDLFYHCDLTRARYEELTKGARFPE